MKKKSNLLLLLLLPLLTSCPPARGDEGPLFTVKGFNSADTIQFNLNDGVDLTVPFGVYNKQAGEYSAAEAEHYMFLVSSGGYEVSNYNREWQCVHRVEWPNSDYYWKRNKYSKETLIHLEPKYFDRENDALTILLTTPYIANYEPEKETYLTKELNHSWYTTNWDTLYYHIDEDQTVTLARNRKKLNSSSSVEASSIKEEALSTEESIESSEVEI